jgi:hypothetical protein
LRVHLLAKFMLWSTKSSHKRRRSKDLDHIQNDAGVEVDDRMMDTSSLSYSRNTIRLGLARCSHDGEICTAVDLIHLRNLRELVRGTSLVNAELVYLKVAVPKLFRNYYGVLHRSRHGVPYTRFVLRLGIRELTSISPYVAERQVAYTGN